ncbi:MAG: hypothetical protein QOI99_84 [Actinomycetota bacterium]|nr:hypothetical protein [Actinomycetota bacterium]
MADDAGITDVLKTLATLGGKRRGMTIEADEWNSLVGAVTRTLELVSAQAALSNALDQRFAPLDHDHVGQVTEEWLDSGVKARLSGAGTVSDTVAGVRVGGEVEQLRSELGRVRSTIEDHQARLDRTIALDVDRASTLRDVREQVGSVDALKGVVRRLDTRVTEVGDSLGQVDELRKSLLDPTGAPIDIAHIRDEVADLGRLRESLTDETGKLIRVRDLASRISEIDVSRGGVGDDRRLDDRIRTRTAEVEDRLGQRVDERLADVDVRIADRVDNARGEVLAQVDASVSASRSEVERSTAAGIAAAMARADSRLADGMATTATTLRAELVAVAASEVATRVGDVGERVRAEVERQSGPLADALRADVTRLAVATVEEGVARSNAGVGERLGGFDARLEGVERNLEPAVDHAVGARLDAVASDLDDRLGGRVDEARKAVETTVDERVAVAVRTVAGDLGGQIDTAVGAALSGVDTRVDARVGSALDRLPGAVSSEVEAQLDQADLPGRIEGLRTQITTQYRAELAAAETRIESNRSTAINEAVTLVRNDLAVATTGLDHRITDEIASTRANVDRLGERVDRVDRVTPGRPDLVVTPVRPIGPARPINQ